MSQISTPLLFPLSCVLIGRVLAGLLALVATAAVVLVLVLGGGSSQDAGSLDAQAQPSLRAGGGPEESGVAATLGSRPAGGPDESSTAASISGR